MKLQKPLFWEQSFPLLRLKGKGSRQFLHGQTSADILMADKDVLIRTCWLSPTGRFKALLEIRCDEQNVDFLVLGGDAQGLLNGFEKVIFPSDNVEVQSIGSILRVQELCYNKSWNTSHVEWVSTSKERSDLFTGFFKASKNDVKEWVFRQGMPIGLYETNGESNPYELGISSLVNLNKGCYLGQETMAKLKNNAHLKQELRFWECEKSNSVIKNLQGMYLETSDKFKAGLIVSHLDVDNGISLGLAIIRRKYLLDYQLLLPNSSIAVDISKPIGFSEFLGENN